MNLSLGFGLDKYRVRNATTLNPSILPNDYWQEEETTNYFIEEETGLILTLEDL